MQAVKPQASKEEPTKKLDELFEPVPKGVKLTSKIDEIEAQLSSLQKQRDFLLSKEKASAIEEINVKIAKLGITARELDFGTPIRGIGSHATAGTRVPIKYKLGLNVWSGRGRQPKWLVDHIAKGGKLEDTLVK
jgi:DNA-binding protein H-NS